MRRSLFAEEQIIEMIKEQETRMPKPRTTTINLKGARYETGTNGGGGGSLQDVQI